MKLGFLIAALVVVVVVVVVLGFSQAKTPDEKSEFLCLVNGGVPARTEAGHYIRCDFPVRINTR